MMFFFFFAAPHTKSIDWQISGSSIYDLYPHFAQPEKHPMTVRFGFSMAACSRPAAVRIASPTRPRRDGAA